MTNILDTKKFIYYFKSLPDRNKIIYDISEKLEKYIENYIFQTPLKFEFNKGLNTCSIGFYKQFIEEIRDICRSAFYVLEIEDYDKIFSILNYKFRPFALRYEYNRNGNINIIINYDNKININNNSYLFLLNKKICYNLELLNNLIKKQFDNYNLEIINSLNLSLNNKLKITPNVLSFDDKFFEKKININFEFLLPIFEIEYIKRIIKNNIKIYLSIELPKIYEKIKIYSTFKPKVTELSLFSLDVSFDETILFYYSTIKDTGRKSLIKIIKEKID